MTKEEKNLALAKTMDTPTKLFGYLMYGFGFWKLFELSPVAGFLAVAILLFLGVTAAMEVLKADAEK